MTTNVKWKVHHVNSLSGWRLTVFCWTFVKNSDQLLLLLFERPFPSPVHSFKNCSLQPSSSSARKKILYSFIHNFHFTATAASSKRKCHKQTFITHEINFHCGNETFDLTQNVCERKTIVKSETVVLGNKTQNQSCRFSPFLLSR